MVLAQQEATKERASTANARRCASSRPRPRCCRFENSRLGLATNFQQVAPRPKRCKPAEGIREMPWFTVESWWSDQTQQGDGAEAYSASPRNRRASGFLGENITEAKLQRALGLIGDAHLIDDLRGAGWTIELFEPGTIVQSDGATIRVVPDTAAAWTISEDKLILLSRSATVEDSVDYFVHEATHAMGGDERAAYTAGAEASLALSRYGGVSANTSPFIRNGQVDVGAINGWMTSQENTAGSLYEQSWNTVAIWPKSGSVTPIFGTGPAILQWP